MLSVRNIVAVVLLALWPVMTSHSFLEQIGFIHHTHADHECGSSGSHEHNSDNHAFADGGYLRGSSHVSIEMAVSASVVPCATPLLLSSTGHSFRWNHGLSPPGAAPPELSSRWQFAHRAAPPARAPSIA